MMLRRRDNYIQNNRRNRTSGVITSDEIKLTGGLNLVDSAREIKPGELLVAKNYEPYFVNGAYRRVAGFEVFDGQPRPHLAEYWVVNLTDISGGPFEIGETVTATPSNKTAVVALYVVDEEAADNSGYIVITDLSDEVDEDETWTGSTSLASGLSADGSNFEGIVDEDDHDDAQLAVEGLRRAVITKVGGALCDGPVRGVHIYNDAVYAFRDLLDNTGGSLWRSSDAGWQQMSLGFKVRFVSGEIEPLEGDTLTGATSGATCTIERIVVTAGFWAGDDAEGYFITTGIDTGPFVAGENLQVGGVTQAVAGVIPQEAQELPLGGKYRLRNNNFGGNSATYRMYGVNGVGNAFEFDGDVFTMIETGMDNDMPSQIGIHRGHLLLGFPGGSLQHSGKNQPLSFTVVTGANELLAGDEITGFIEEISDVTFVFTRNKTFRLEGFVQENIQLKLHSLETGALEDTIQRIGRSVYLDDRGFTNIPATDRFGDFSSNQISMKIDPLVQLFLKEATPVASMIHRGKSVYRCFFSNHEAISIGFSGNSVNGITVIDYGMELSCTANGEIVGIDPISEEDLNSGEERTFFGDLDGWVYESDVGRNFNGEMFEAYVITAYHFSGDPELNKRYRRMTLYMEGNGRATMKVSADYNYNEEPSNFETILERAVPLGGGRYGIARHGNFRYSAKSKTDIRVPMNSHARNVSMIFYTEQANEEPHILYAMTFHVSGRRIIRN